METRVISTGKRMPLLARVARWVSYRLNDLCFWSDHDNWPRPKSLFWHVCDWLRNRLNRYWIRHHLRSLPPDMFGQIYRRDG